MDLYCLLPQCKPATSLMSHVCNMWVPCMLHVPTRKAGTNMYEFDECMYVGIVNNSCTIYRNF